MSGDGIAWLRRTVKNGERTQQAASDVHAAVVEIVRARYSKTIRLRLDMLPVGDAAACVQSQCEAELGWWDARLDDFWPPEARR